MTDRVALRGLRVQGRHGVYEQERVLGQTFVVDVELRVDTREAAATDDLAHTVDYADLATRVSDLVAGEPVNLIETLANRIAAECLADARVRQVEVTVHKPQAPMRVSFDDVAVTITRERTSS